MPKILQIVLTFDKVKKVIQGEKNMEKKNYEEKGYLNEDYKIFYLEEMLSREIEYHYHNFDKIIIFFRGNMEYIIEGKSYTLLPNDIVLVPRGDSHKVKLSGLCNTDIGYTRMVIYISPEYLSALSDKTESLRDCFMQVAKKHSHVIRLKEKRENQLLYLIESLKDSACKNSLEMFHGMYQRTLVMQFLIILNRKMKQDGIYYVGTSCCNQKIVEIIHYINNHLKDDMDINSLSEKFYISRYYMMRQFKAETGYTIGNYVNQKRLLLAREMLKKGHPVTKTYLDVGFKEYSTFVRAYKQMFNEIPSKIIKIPE